MMTDVTKFRYETFDFGDAVNLSTGSASSLETAKKEALAAKKMAEKIVAEAPPEPEVVTFSEAEMEAAKKAAHAEGKAEGVREEAGKNSEALSAEKVRAEALLAKVDAQIASHAQNAEKKRAETTEKLKALSFAAAKKVVSGLSDSSLKQIENFIDGAMGVVDEEQEVKLHLNPKTAKDFIEKMDARFEHLKIEEDAGIAEGDLQLIWNSGFAERKLDDLWRDIGKIIVGEFDVDEFKQPEPEVAEASAAAPEAKVEEGIEVKAAQPEAVEENNADNMADENKNSDEEVTKE